MTIRPISFSMLLANLFLGCSLSVSAATPPKPDSRLIGEQLAGADPALRAQAWTAACQWLQTNPGLAASELRLYWGRADLTSEQCQELADLTLQAILAKPDDVGTLQGILELRVKALLWSGKPAEALASAKSLYNVVPMERTASALALLASCLEKAHPEDPGLYERFRQEQTAGAKLGPKAPPAPLMASIRIDPAPYEAALKNLQTQDPNPRHALQGSANLLLIMDRIKEARTQFAQYHALGVDAAQATANQARLMKAEDGTIGRSNDYLIEDVDSPKPSAPGTPPPKPKTLDNVPLAELPWLFDLSHPLPMILEPAVVPPITAPPKPVTPGGAG